MKFVDSALRLSPSDLSNHLVCPHLTTLDLAVAQGQLRPPAAQSQLLDALRARGLEHERVFVESLRQRGLVVADVPGEGLTQERFEATRAAMSSGAGAIVQAPLGHAGWAGYADVLLRIEIPSNLGPWSYEALDTKLARETRGATIRSCASTRTWSASCRECDPSVFTSSHPAIPSSTRRIVSTTSPPNTTGVGLGDEDGVVGLELVLLREIDERPHAAVQQRPKPRARNQFIHRTRILAGEEQTGFDPVAIGIGWKRHKRNIVCPS